jgi:hypothetical protein
MKKALLPALVLVVFSWTVRGESDTSHHKAVYAEINDSEASLRKVTASIKEDSGTISLTGWIDGGEVRKIVAKPGSTGSGADEYYLEKEKPLFVFSTYEKANPDTGKVIKKVEERIYFEDGSIVKWLTSDKSAPVLHGEDYASQADYLNSHCADFVEALKKKAAGNAQ